MFDKFEVEQAAGGQHEVTLSVAPFCSLCSYARLHRACFSERVLVAGAFE